MRTNNKGVAVAWFNGESAVSHNGNFHTDGKRIYSYGLLIGVTTDSGEKIVFCYRGEHRISVTTTMHVGLIMWQYGYTSPTIITPQPKNEAGYGYAYGNGWGSSYTVPEAYKQYA